MARAGATTTKRASTVPRAELDDLTAGQHSDPHRILGVHGTTVRALRPGATGIDIVLPDKSTKAMEQIHPGGVFEGELPSTEVAGTYRLCADYGTGPGFVFDDPYKAWPTLGELDLH